MMKQIAASFVKGLEKRRSEMADKILAEVAEAMQDSGGGASGVSEAMLEQAAARVREAREAQIASDRQISGSVKLAAETWAESSASAVTGVLQKELGKITDGVATNLAQQLSQSRRFCDSLARGVQRSSGAATKQALESLRPPQRMQETMSAALGEALRESLAPVFRTELRTHFEQELAPLIAKRISDMMGSFRDRMGECLSRIAAEHEQAAKRLGRDLAPVVTEELRQVGRILARQEAASQPTASEALSDTQVEEMARAVQAEVVEPLHARIRDLSAQVSALREEASRLERRCEECRLLTEERAAAGGAGTAVGREEAVERRSEEAQAEELERLFREQRAEEAFVRAMKLQAQARRVDFVGRLCGLVEEPDRWLEGGDAPGGKSPLSMPVKMLLMLSLGPQLENSGLSDEDRASRVEWINELWLAFDWQDASVASNAAGLCKQLGEVLEKSDKAFPAGSTASKQLRQLRRNVQSTTGILANRR